MPRACFGLILHSHLPYVIDHGTWPHGMDWLNEAAAESYMPLLGTFEKLHEEGHGPKTTLSMTPVLLEQLASPAFARQFKSYLQQRIEAAQEDARTFQKESQQHLASVANMWIGLYRQRLADFVERYNEDLISGFRRLQEAGAIEIMTSAATHGYLPLLAHDSAVKAQVRVGIQTYRKHFGVRPRGFWLPECAYRPRYLWNPPVEGHGGPRLREGLEEILHDHGISYFVIDSHLLEGGKPIGTYVFRFQALRQMWDQFRQEWPEEAGGVKKSLHDAYLVSSSDGEKPVAVFTRDRETGLQVWSGERGYPGDGNYLEFHKKRYPGGLRYWKVTRAKSDLAEKEEYCPQVIDDRLKENARHFTELVKSVVEGRPDSSGYSIVAAPFDTELLGHWWFEGPQWLYYVLRSMDVEPALDLVTCSEYLDLRKPAEVISIPEGSWGEGGFHWVWLNKDTTWTWEAVYDAEAKMRSISSACALTQDRDLERILVQLARELLLLESSDWQFLITTWHARDYAEARVKRHYNDFLRLHEIAQGKMQGELSDGDWQFVVDCERRDFLFDDIDFRWWGNEEVEG